MQRVDLDERLESAAEFGNFHYFWKINSRKVISLKENGFNLREIASSRSWPKLYEISWKNAKVALAEGKPLEDLDIFSPDFTQAQRLWIIASKANNK